MYTLICHKQAHSNLTDVTDSKLEKLIYLYEVFEQYPEFFQHVFDDYFCCCNESKWSISKVCCLFILIVVSVANLIVV